MSICVCRHPGVAGGVGVCTGLSWLILSLHSPSSEKVDRLRGDVVSDLLAPRLSSLPGAWSTSYFQPGVLLGHGEMRAGVNP